MTHILQVKLSPMVRTSILTNRERGHVHVMSAFPRIVGDSPRSAFQVLWALGPQTRTLTVQSSTPAESPEVLGEILEHRLLEPPAEGESVQLQVTLAAQKTPAAQVTPELRTALKANGGKAYRSRLVLVPEEERPEWARKRLERIGLAVESDRLTVSPLQQTPLGKRGTSIPAVTVAARGRVQDATAFEQALRSGVGKGKNFGLGLIQLKSTSTN